MEPSFEEIAIAIWRQVLVENAPIVTVAGKHYRVITSKAKKFRQVVFDFDGGSFIGIEQNPKTNSRWAGNQTCARSTTSDGGQSREAAFPAFFSCPNWDKWRRAVKGKVSSFDERLMLALNLETVAQLDDVLAQPVSDYAISHSELPDEEYDLADRMYEEADRQREPRNRFRLLCVCRYVNQTRFESNVD